MELIFARHGAAVGVGAPGAPDDFSRMLTPEGRRRLQAQAAALRALGVRFDLALTSPLVRARETASILVRSQAPEPVELLECEELRPGVAWSNLARVLAPCAARVHTALLVGHEPDMSSLVSWMCFDRVSENFVFQTGMMACVAPENFGSFPRARLRWLLPPDLMIAIAEASEF